MSVTTLYKKKFEILDIDEYFPHNPYPRSLDREAKDTCFNMGTRANPDMYHYYHKKSYKNIPEDMWKEKSFSPYTCASVRRVTIVVEKDGDKIRLSLYYFKKGRKVSKKYFWTTQTVGHLTFNTKTKDVFLTTTIKAGRKRRVNVKKNPFKFWYTSMFDIDDVLLFLGLPSMVRNSNYINTINEIDTEVGEDLFEFRDRVRREVFTAFNHLTKELFGHNPVRYSGLKEMSAQWFVENRGIKIPNNWMGYFLQHYPGLRKIRRCDNKLLTAILKENKILSKYSTKLFNTYDNIDIELYKFLENLLGVSLFREVKPEVLQLFSVNIYYGSEERKSWLYDTLTITEKRNIISTLNSVTEYETIGTNNNRFSYIASDLIGDHLCRIKSELWKEGDRVRYKATNLKEFKREHDMWTTRLEDLRRNNEVIYKYDREFIDYIEAPLSLSNNVTVFPIILKNDLQYTEEGRYQKHCVGTYVESSNSCIISLRCTDGIRYTVEYRIDNKSVGWSRIQCRGKCNSSAPNEFKDVLKEIDKRVAHTQEEGIYKKPKVEVVNLINNNRRIISESLDFDIPF